MTGHRLLVLVILVLAATVLAQAPKKAEPAAPAFDFKARMQQIMDAWSTLDPSKAAPFYSPDKGNVFYDIAPLKYVGWAAYAQGFQQVASDFSSIKMAVGKDAAAHTRGNLAWGTATWHMDVVMKDGKKEAMDGRWTAIWQKTGDDWLVVHEHVSVPLPEPAKPEPAKKEPAKKAAPKK